MVSHSRSLRLLGYAGIGKFSDTDIGEYSPIPQPQLFFRRLLTESRRKMAETCGLGISLGDSGTCGLTCDGPSK